MTKGQEPERMNPEAGINPRPSQTDTSPPQTDHSPSGPDKDRQIAQESQQSTGLGPGQS